MIIQIRGIAISYTVRRYARRPGDATSRDGMLLVRQRFRGLLLESHRLKREWRVEQRSSSGAAPAERFHIVHLATGSVGDDGGLEGQRPSTEQPRSNHTHTNAHVHRGPSLPSLPTHSNAQQETHAALHLPTHPLYARLLVLAIPLSVLILG